MAPTAACRKTTNPSDNRINPSFSPCGTRRRVASEASPAPTVETISMAAPAACASRAQPAPDSIAPANTASMKIAAARAAVMTVHHRRGVRLGSVGRPRSTAASYESAFISGSR